MGYTGFEPVTSALSRQRSKPTELITLFQGCKYTTHFKDFMIKTKSICMLQIAPHEIKTIGFCDFFVA